MHGTASLYTIHSLKGKGNKTELLLNNTDSLRFPVIQNDTNQIIAATQLAQVDTCSGFFITF